MTHGLGLGPILNVVVWVSAQQGPSLGGLRPHRAIMQDQVGWT